MIYLFTGSPGSGKTLSAMEFIRSVRQETPDRLIYLANVEGVNIPGVIELDNEGVVSWFESCEKNSLLVVDEAQKYWRAQRSGEPAHAILEMETHRHDGIDIVLMTQHPTFLHANIRKLVNHHVHLVSYTKTSSLRWQWRECHDDVQDNALRAAGDFKEWFYPPELFSWYSSATQHTKRVKRPLKQVVARVVLWFLGLLLVAFVVGFGFWAYRHHSVAGVGAPAPAARAFRASPVVPAPGATSDTSQAVHLSTADYLQAQIPRVPAQPWSAPLYDGQAVVRHPRVFCLAMEPPGHCGCITEQGTKYAMDQVACRNLVAAGGAYDPYLPVPADSSQGQPSQYQSPVTGQPAAASVGDGLAVGGAGDYRGVGKQDYAPPTYLPWNAEAVASRRK